MSSYQRFRTSDLYAQGLSKRDIALAVAVGHLVRVRRGWYVRGDSADACREAAALGGRADCVTALREYEVFVLDRSPVHVQIAPGRSKLPHAGDAVRHWRESEAEFDAGIVPPLEAVRQAVACLECPYAIVATVDSALHIGLLTTDQLPDIFTGQSRRKRRLMSRVNRHAESGSESIVRMLLEELGCEVRVQVRFAGVGRVDLLVDGWLVIECDSREYHSSPQQQVKDRRRDRMLAARGYITLRLIAEDIYYQRAEVIAALRGVLARGRPRSQHPLRRPLGLGRAA